MNELLDNNPTQQETIKGELDLTFIQVAKINDRINDIEARLSSAPPPAEMAMLGRMALGLERRREDLISWFSYLTIRNSPHVELAEAVKYQPEIVTDDNTFDVTVAEIIANLPPLTSTEVVPEIVKEQVFDESIPTEISPATETVQPIEGRRIKPKTTKSKKVSKNNVTKQTKQPTTAANTMPKVSSKRKVVAKPHSKTISPNRKPTDWQEMMEVRKRYLASLSRISDEPIVLTERQRLNPNIDQRLLKFLMGQGKKPTQPLSEKKKIVTYNAFSSIPEDQRRPGWQQRMIEAQIA